MADFGWLVRLDGPHAGAVPVTDASTGDAAGHLLVVRGRAKPDRSAVRIEPSVIGDGVIGGGPAQAVSLVLPPRGARPLFDDPAVVHAMRAVLRDPGRARVFSTLVDGSTRWAGTLSGIDIAVTEAWPGWWHEDPFARLGPQQQLLVPAGVLCPAPLPAGPGHQRHAGSPWPWGRFDVAVATS